MPGGYGTSPLELLARDAMIQGLAYLDEFTYSCHWKAGTSSALGANGDKTQQIHINSDSDFIAQMYNLTAYLPDMTPIGVPPYLITITRSGSGRNIMDDAQMVANFCGNYIGHNTAGSTVGATGPGRLTISSLYQGNSTVSVRLQNMSNVIPDHVDFVMKGFKVFYQANRAGQVGNRQDIFHAL